MKKLLIPPMAALAVTLAATPARADELVVSRSAQSYVRDAASAPGEKARYLEPSESKRTELATRAKGDTDARVASHGGMDFWVYDADASVSFDRDGDGYYHYLTVRFDVDTWYESAYVYAMLFLSADGETWEHYLTTDDFLVEGATDLDEYQVETELVSGYPPGLYDVLVEIYDADFGEYVDEFGPAQSSALSLLPLEDTSYDGVEVTVTVTEEHGGGAVSWWLLGLIGAAGALRRCLGREVPRA